jgi:hypothetical protein
VSHKVGIVHTPAPIHVGHRPPGAGDYLPLQNPGWRSGRDEPVQVSALNKADIDWAKHEIEPRWIGSETADCVAALQPGWYHNRGARERDRFLEGAASRGETALVISLLGHTDDTTWNVFGDGGDSVELANTMCAVHGQKLPAATKATLATGLAPADADLGKRLLNRTSDAPWWSLDLSGHTTMRGDGGPSVDHPAVGELVPLLVDPLGEPVVGVWLSPNKRIRWYIIPDHINWNAVLDWLIHQAIPAYVPAAAQRHRSSSFVDTTLLTPTESRARQALADMESQYAEERARLDAELAEAQNMAEPVRNGLLYGTADTLVAAVATVLRAAGFDVVDLDEELGDTRSADLLATFGDHRRLIEVKSEGRNASESLINALRRHLQTWPQLRPELPVGGGVLVVNHQLRLPPADRSPTVYSRPEFVATLAEPIISTRALFDWWRAEDWTAIQRVVLGADPAPSPPAQSLVAPSSGPLGEQQSSTGEVPATQKRRWFWRRR